MKLTFFMTVCLTYGLSASVLSQQKVTMNLEQATIKEILTEFERQTGHIVIYSSEKLETNRKMRSCFNNVDVETFLKSVLSACKMSYSVQDDYILIVPEKTQTLPQQKKLTITGKVTDDKKQPLPGVSVFVKGATLGVATDTDGKYKFEIPDIDGITLVYRFIGMKTEERIVKGKTVIDVMMAEDVNEIEEVVVTGIFNKAKESFTGAATFISKEELKAYGSRNLLRTLNNIDPSFNIIENNKEGSNPNALPEINLRGTTSVPMDIKSVQQNERANLNTPLFILDGFEITLERMMDLDEEEIESVTILKDASSTAIYGSRGSNGVVVLTSVQPKEGKLRVNVRGSLDLEIPDLSSYNVLDAREKLALEELAGLYKDDILEREMELRDVYSKKKGDIESGVNTYWLSQPLRTSAGQDYGISLSGGDPAFRYSMNLSYGSTVGIMKGSYRNNLNGSITISYLYKNIQFTNMASLGLNNAEDTEYGSFRTYTELNPYWAPFDDNGKMILWLGEKDPLIGSPVKNPLYDPSLAGYAKSEYTNFRDNLSVEWRPVKELKIGLRAGYTKNIAATDDYKPSTHSFFDKEEDLLKKGSYRYTTTTGVSYDMDATLSYAKVIDNHSIFVGFNGSLRESKSVSYGMGTQGFTHDRLDFISMGAQYDGEVPSGSENTNRSIGFTGNVNYNYNNCVYVDGSYRTDGASSFGEQSRFKSFYSIGVGWTVSRMNFFKDHVTFVSNLRFKYNYGVTGSLQAQSPYEAMTTYQYNIKDRYNGRLAASIMGYGNPNLSWQHTYSHNLGIELGLFQGLFSFDMNLYKKITKGVVTKAALSLSHGYDNYTENKGDVLNKGLDMNLSVRLIRQGDVNWSVRAGLAYNKNVLLKLSDEMKKISAQAEEYGLTDPNYLYREGESMDALYVVPSLGIDPATGKEMFLQRNGAVSYTWDKTNRIPFGLTQPKVNGRISSSLRYKGLSVTASFALRLGGQKYNTTLVSKVENANITKNVDKRVYEERWRGPGDYAKYKGLTVKSVAQQSSRFVQDESTFVFNSLNVSYNTSSKWLMTHLYISALTFSARMNDLFYLSTVKQERGTDYPFSRKPTFSVSITF